MLSDKKINYMSTNYFIGIYRLAPNIILRRGYDTLSVFNINNSTSIKISIYLYFVLDIFSKNATNLTEIQDLFAVRKINCDLREINNILNGKKYLSDILVKIESGKDDGSLKVKELYSKKFMQFDKNGLIYEPTPERVDLFITNRCNLKCPHCYRDASAFDQLNQIDINRFKEILDEMEYLRVQTLKITGGEPFIVPQLFEIVRYASKKRIHIILLTNATIRLDSSWTNLLSNKKVLTCISLDGASENTHDVIRGKGSFKKTMENLKLLSHAGARFSITFTANKHNIFDLENIFNIANELGAETLHYNIIEETGRATINPRLTNDSLMDIVENFVKEKESCQDRSKYTHLDYTNNHGLVSDEKAKELINKKGNAILCSAGVSSIAIDSLLNVYPCIFGIGGLREYPIASLTNHSILEVWRSSEFDVFRGKTKINQLLVCSKCNFSTKCMLKHCRLRPMYEGRGFYDPVSFCHLHKELQ
jgi:radical SAM protein with 4Fe4S-binding SPASM domain